jgi:hypothetical protein
MAYESSLLFDSVVVIESLNRQKSEPTGMNLFENTIAPALDRHGMSGGLYQITTRAEFFGCLRQTLQMTKDGHAPILHIEAHGDSEGLELASEQHIKWSELAPALTEINLGCQMNLLVVAAACEGWYLGSVLQPINRSPVWGVIGPPTITQAGKLYAATTSFYREMLESFDLSKALRAMNDHGDIDAWDFDLSSAELIFCIVFRHYMRDLIEGETQEQRANRLVADIARMKRLDVEQTMKLRAEITADLSDHKRWFEHYKHHFLMLDLFPQNARRFTYTFEDCTRQAA